MINRWPTVPKVFLLLILTVAALCSPASGKDQSLPEETQGAQVLDSVGLEFEPDAEPRKSDAPSLLPSPDSIDEQMADSAKSKDALFGKNRLHDRWAKTMNRLENQTGLRFTVDYSSLVQWANESIGDDLASSGDFRLAARWRMWGRESGNIGRINFQVRNRHQYSSIAPSRLGASVGSLWPTARGYNDAGWDVIHAYYQQYFPDQGFTFRLGLSRVDNMLDAYAFRSQRLFFINSAFSDNPGVAFPSFGPTALVGYRPIENLNITLGAGSSDFLQLESIGNLLRREDWFTAGQIGWSPKIFSEGSSLLQAMYWYGRAAPEAQTPDGEGVSLVAQHTTPEDLTVFARYAYSASTATIAQHMASTGVGLTPFDQRDDDVLGLAFAYGRPSVRSLRDQYVVESFYRIQLTSQIQLTPDIQFIFNPSLNPTEDMIVIVGGRARISF
jgi:porin